MSSSVTQYLQSHAPPLITSSQLRGYSPNFSPLPQLLHSHPGPMGSTRRLRSQHGQGTAPAAGARAGSPGPEGAVLPLEQDRGWALPPRQRERTKASAFVLCTHY